MLVILCTMPPLKPESPWHGYDLGVWPEQLARQAEKAARSEYFELSDELIGARRTDVRMNEPVVYAEPGPGPDEDGS